jgi:hypothetical protein
MDDSRATCAREGGQQESVAEGELGRMVIVVYL